MKEIVKESDLCLGDVVEVFDGPFGTAIVKDIKDDYVEFFRPYGLSGDFSTVCGVPCYVGIEIWKSYNKTAKIILLDKKQNTW